MGISHRRRRHRRALYDCRLLRSGDLDVFHWEPRDLIPPQSLHHRRRR